MSRQDTLTVYFCGSGNNREQTDKFLIPFLFDQTIRKVENLYDPGGAIIFDGPGGKYFMPRYYSKTVKKHVEAGDYNKALRIAAWKKNPSAGRIRAPLIDGLSGSGATSNVLAAWAWLSKRFSEDQAFTRINLLGFSRGAYSCLVLAKILDQDDTFSDREAEVNILTLDPVPGGHDTIVPSANDAFRRSGFGTSFNKSMNIQNPEQLPSIVKNYRSIVQSRIRKYMFGWMGGYARKDYVFKSVVPSWAPGTQRAERSMKIFIMPGRHSASASLDPKFANSGMVARHICATFLRENGTEMEDDLRLSPQELARNLRRLDGKLDGKNANKTGYKAEPSKNRGVLIEQIRDVAQNDDHVDLVEFSQIAEHFEDLRAQNTVQQDGHLVQAAAAFEGLYRRVMFALS